MINLWPFSSPKAEWHHIAKVFSKGNLSLYCDGKPRTYQPEIWFDEVRLSSINRYPEWTLDYWIGIKFSIKHWTYAQKWSLAQCMKRYTNE